MEMAYYQNKQFRIARKNKAMARLVSENFMTAIDQLIEDDPALADTLAIMLNPEIREALGQGEKDYRAGKAVPLDEILEEYDQ